MQQRPSSHSDTPAATGGLPSGGQRGPRPSHAASHYPMQMGTTCVASAVDAQAAASDCVLEAMRRINIYTGLVNNLCDTMTRWNPTGPPVTTCDAVNAAVSNLVNEANQLKAERDEAIARAAVLATRLAELQDEHPQADEASVSADTTAAPQYEGAMDESATVAQVSVASHCPMHLDIIYKAMRFIICHRDLVNNLCDTMTSWNPAAPPVTAGDLNTAVTSLKNDAARTASELDDTKAERDEAIERTTVLAARLAELQDEHPQADEASMSADTTAAPQYESTMGESATVAQVAD